MIFPFMAVILSTLSVFLYIRVANNYRFFDYANERSMHEAIIPRGGGVPFVLVAVLVSFAWSLFNNLPPLYGLYTSIIILLVIGAIDDLNRAPGSDGLAAIIRIIAHICSAIIVVWCYASGSYFWQILVLLAIIWWINLTNFMDGIDGIAGGFAAIVHGYLAFWAHLDGEILWFIFNISIVAALVGFLVFNWFPARIFMGDSGSTVLGLTIGIAGLKSTEGVLDVLPFALLSMPFWLDATYTLFVRIRRGEKFWQAHRSHFYQRVVVHKSNPEGVPVAAVTAIYIGFSFIFGLIASMIRMQT